MDFFQENIHYKYVKNSSLSFSTIIAAFRHASSHPTRLGNAPGEISGPHTVVALAHPPFKSVFTTWVHGHWKIYKLQQVGVAFLQLTFLLKNKSQDARCRAQVSEWNTNRGYVTPQVLPVHLVQSISTQAWKVNNRTSKSIVLSITLRHCPENFLSTHLEVRNPVIVSLEIWMFFLTFPFEWRNWKWIWTMCQP